MEKKQNAEGKHRRKEQHGWTNSREARDMVGMEPATSKGALGLPGRFSTWAVPRKRDIEWGSQTEWTA